MLVELTGKEAAVLARLVRQERLKQMRREVAVQLLGPLERRLHDVADAEEA